MPTSDYQSGYQAYFNGEPFDSTQSQGWQEGWEEAECDDYDPYNYNIDLEDY